MRVITQDAIGGPEVLHLAESGMPEPGVGEVLVRIAAAGVNPVDIAVRTGAFPLLGEPPFVLGWDIAGTVERIGAGVTGFTIGDRIMGLARFPREAGAYAEFAAVPAAEMVRIPFHLTDPEAAALPLAGLSAWQALVETAGLKAGQTVLVHAGAGGVGHLAIQIAKAAGAWVATTVSAGKIDPVLEFGANEVIDYRSADFTERKEGFDVVLETIGGDHVERSLDVTKPGGVIVCLKTPSDAARRKAEAKHVRLETILVRPDGAGMEKLADLLANGGLVVRVARTFPLADAASAHRFLETGPVGKVVLLV